MIIEKIMKSGTIIKIIFWIGIILNTAIFIITRFGSQPAYAVAGMAYAIYIVWCILLGGLMYLLKDVVKAVGGFFKLPWQLKFFLGFVSLALLEEAFTVSMTNLAPLFGAKLGEAFITASADYLDVVLYHSVILFIPIIAAFTWILRKYRFSPNQLFLFFGLIGTGMETLYGGFTSALEFSFWIPVYGLMIWLPAYAFAPEEGKVRWYQYFITFVVIIVFWLLFFVIIALLGLIFPESYFYQLLHHPRIHFQ
jgi:hypothetical protein